MRAGLGLCARGIGGGCGCGARSRRARDGHDRLGADPETEQRHGDSVHRPAGERRIAGECRGERMGAGYADRKLKEPAEPLAAANRRIEILLKGSE